MKIENYIILLFKSLLLFIVTLDYKALLLLAVKKDDENFKLAGTGLDVEFCIFCTAIRVGYDLYLVCHLKGMECFKIN